VAWLLLRQDGPVTGGHADLWGHQAPRETLNNAGIAGVMAATA
jgi:hypothetical protein